MKTNFEKLQVYQLSEKVADEIWTLMSEWDHFDKDTVGKQIVRAADSIGANIAEGVGKAASKTIGVLYEMREVPCMKPNTG